MVVGALLGSEALTVRKSIGVVTATLGVALALLSGLASAPPGAWRGDLLMVAAALCMALYNVWSRPFIARSGPIPFAAAGMGVGAAALTGLSALSGGLAQFAGLAAPQWLACAYLAVVCGALIFFLWAYAMGRAPPTLVAVSVAVNPVTASLFGVLLLGEPVSPALVIGLVLVLAGIAIASGGRGGKATTASDGSDRPSTPLPASPPDRRR
jgi:drug/metabolite transporter (DMT)-like permease